MRSPAPPRASTLQRTVAISAACGGGLSGDNDDTSNRGTTVYSGDQPPSTVFPIASRTTVFTRYVPGADGVQDHDVDVPSWPTFSPLPSEIRKETTRSPTPPFASTFQRTVAISAACGGGLSGDNGDTVSCGTTAYFGDQPLSTEFPIASRTTAFTRYVPGADGVQ
ncbi:MAG TPA: hypothetical protein DD658_01170, partial [Deltaproteobacteria bacterium]|nr:hypothetical protein [Deltaproteobacteria bacterium]